MDSQRGSDPVQVPGERLHREPGLTYWGREVRALQVMRWVRPGQYLQP